MLDPDTCRLVRARGNTRTGGHRSGEQLPGETVGGDVLAVMLRPTRAAYRVAAAGPNVVISRGADLRLEALLQRAVRLRHRRTSETVTAPKSVLRSVSGAYHTWRCLFRGFGGESGRNLTALTCDFLVRPLGFEPRTCGLRGSGKPCVECR